MQRLSILLQCSIYLLSFYKNAVRRAKLQLQFQRFDHKDENHRKFKFSVYFMQRLFILLQCFIYFLSFYKNDLQRAKFEPAF